MDILVWSAVIVIVLFLILVGKKNSKKEKQKYLNDQVSVFGKRCRAEFDSQTLTRIKDYHAYKYDESQTFAIDETTANDLEIDTLYAYMNHCQSSPGEDVLYHRLITTYSSDASEEFGKICDYLTEHEEQRLESLFVLHKLSFIKGDSFHKRLNDLKEYKTISVWPHIFTDLLLVISFSMIFVFPGPGVLAFLIFVVLSVGNYFKTIGNIGIGFSAFTYASRLLCCGESLSQIYASDAEKVPAFNNFSELIDELKPLGKWRVFLPREASSSSNPIAMVSDYLRMIFHVDIIVFAFLHRFVTDHENELSSLYDTIGSIDAAISVASFIESLPSHCKPEFSEADEHVMELKGAYHPLITEPVTNDFVLQKNVLLTGSNASGKSTFLKTIGLCSVLAQNLGFVPTKFYRASRYKVYSSMALRDNLLGNESYYIVEARSLKRILDASDSEHVLCIVDEVLRGTNTEERIIASHSILRYLCEKSVCVFAATHDSELTEMLNDVYDNYHFTESVTDSSVSFPYTIFPGVAKKKNAIRLLKLLGYPQQVIERCGMDLQ